MIAAAGEVVNRLAGMQTGRRKTTRMGREEGRIKV